MNQQRGKLATRTLRLRTLFAFLILVSCSSADGGEANSDGGDTTPSDSSTISTTSSTTISAAPTKDLPAELLDRFVATSGADGSTAIVEHSCGSYALTYEMDYFALLQWSEDDWVPEDVSADMSGGGVIEGALVADVTRDGQPEIIINWFQEQGDYPDTRSGQVLYADSISCEWRIASQIEGSRGESEFIDELAVLANGSLRGAGYLTFDSGYERLDFVWNPDLELFLARPIGNQQACRNFSENFDLAIMLCDKGWAVQMAQEAILRNGIPVDIDGQFGPGTQIAVLSYQQRNDLLLTGFIDEVTWSHMYPVGGPDGTNFSEFPDFDGDGVSSPREIGHASGSFGD